jgi:hypothetical protein
MKNRLATLAAAAGLALTLLTTACTQMPTEKQGLRWAPSATTSKALPRCA